MTDNQLPPLPPLPPLPTQQTQTTQGVTDQGMGAISVGANDLAGNPVPSAPDPSASQTPVDGSNPLDALEAILEEAKKKSGSSGTGAPGDKSTDDKDDEAQDEAEQAKKQAELEALTAAQQTEDAAALQAKIADIQQVTQSPEYQARMDQDNDKQQAQAEEQQARDEYAIVQLKHTKI